MVVLKIKLGEDTRRISVPDNIDYNVLCYYLTQLFPNFITSYTAKYIDDEGDKILLTSDEELREALRVVKEMAGGRPGVMRLELFPKRDKSHVSRPIHPLSPPKLSLLGTIIRDGNIFPEGSLLYSNNVGQIPSAVPSGSLAFSSPRLAPSAPQASTSQALASQGSIPQVLTDDGGASSLSGGFHMLGLPSSIVPSVQEPVTTPLLPQQEERNAVQAETSSASISLTSDTQQPGSILKNGKIKSPMYTVCEALSNQTVVESKNASNFTISDCANISKDIMDMCTQISNQTILLCKTATKAVSALTSAAASSAVQETKSNGSVNTSSAVYPFSILDKNLLFKLSDDIKAQCNDLASDTTQECHRMNTYLESICKDISSDTSNLTKEISKEVMESLTREVENLQAASKDSLAANQSLMQECAKLSQEILSSCTELSNTTLLSCMESSDDVVSAIMSL